jgi:D-aminopeptidase
MQPPSVVRERIEHAVHAALMGPARVAPYDPGKPCTIEVELGSSDHSEKYRQQRLVEVVDGRTIRSTADTWWDAWRQFYFLDS